MLQSKRVLKSQRAVVATAVTAALLGAGAMLYRSAVPRTAERSPIDAASHDRALVYAIELETSLTAGEQNIAHMFLKGYWRVEGTHYEGKAFAVTRFEDATVTSKFADAQEAVFMDAVRKELEHPLAFSVDQSGALKEVREPAEMPPEVAMLAKSVPAYTQFVRSEQRASHWTSHEQDATGDYDASYEEVEDGVFSKKKVAYTRVLAASAGPLKGASELEVSGSAATYHFDSSGTLTRLELSEEVTANTKLAGAMTATTRLVLKLDRSEKGRSAHEEVQGMLLSKLQNLPKGRSSLRGDYARAGDRDARTLLDTFEQLPPFRERDAAQKELERQTFVALAARLRIDDSAVDLLLERIRDGARNVTDLAAALGSAGTPKAQDALRALIDMPDWKSEERRAQMIALSTVERPTSDTIDFLRDKFDDPEQGRQARFGIGTTVYRLKDVAPEEANRAFGMLTSELEAHTDPSATVDLLTGVGNTGHPDATAVVEPYLHAEETQVRAAAVQGIRLVPGDEVDQKLATVLMRDSDPMVRLSAIDAMSDRDPSAPGLTALMHAAEQDPEDDVRKEATKLIARFASGSDEVKNALAQYESDKSRNGG